MQEILVYDILPLFMTNRDRNKTGSLYLLLRLLPYRTANTAAELKRRTPQSNGSKLSPVGVPLSFVSSSGVAVFTGSQLAV